MLLQMTCNSQSQSCMCLAMLNEADLGPKGRGWVARALNARGIRSARGGDGTCRPSKIFPPGRHHNVPSFCRREKLLVAFRASRRDVMSPAARAPTVMPTDACQVFYDCKGCGALLRPEAGDCCVFYSYGSVPCPPMQEGASAGAHEPCCAAG